MAQINIAELATEGISLSDFFVKADASGLASKNTLQNLATLFETVGSVAFRGSIAAADATVTLDGWYFAEDTGTYTNNGGLVIDVSDNLVIIIVQDTQTTFSKVDIPITITIDATPTPESPNAVQSGGVFDYINNQLLSESIISPPDFLNFNGSGSVWRVVSPVSGIVAKYKGITKSNIAVDKPLVDNYNYLIFDLVSGDILVESNVTTANNYLKNKDLYLLVGVVYPKFKLFDVRCDYSVNGLRNSFDKQMITIPTNPDALSFVEEAGVWKLKAIAANLTFRSRTKSVNNLVADLVIPTGTFVYIIGNLDTGEITLETDRNTVDTLLNGIQILIGVCYPQFNIFDVKCPFNINGVRSEFTLSPIVNITTKPEWFSFVEELGVWKLKATSGTVGFSLDKLQKVNTATDLTLVSNSYNYIYGDITTGDILTTTNITTFVDTLKNRTRYFQIARIYPSLGIFDVKCAFNINGVKSVLNQVNVDEIYTFSVANDTPIFTNTLAFTDEQELPIYKDSLFKNFNSSKKFNVILETIKTDGRYKRYDIANPTYLKASDIGTNVNLILENKQVNNKLIFKPITKVIKGFTTGKSGTLNLLTIGDSIQQGNGGVTTMPLNIIKNRLSNYGVTVNGVGTFAMDLGATTGTAPTSSYMGEGRGFWNYKTFVGKDNSPYGTPVSVATGTGATLKFENPFLRLANSTDKTNNPTWCFSNATENPSDTDGVSYATNPSIPSGKYYIFDFDNYLSVRSLTTPDVITIALMVNDWQESGVINITDELLSFQIMYNQIRTALPTVPIAIVPTQSLFPQDQPEWENEALPLAERIIKQIEIYQLTDSNLHQIPIFQHMSRYNSYNTLGTQTDISANNNIKEALINDVHVLDRLIPRQEYMDVFESVILSLI